LCFANYKLSRKSATVHVYYIIVHFYIVVYERIRQIKQHTLRGCRTAHVTFIFLHVHSGHRPTIFDKQYYLDCTHLMSKSILHAVCVAY